jgi:hypothetical protein
VVSLRKGEKQMGYSNLKKFGNKIYYFNKKIKEVLLVNKKFKIFKIFKIPFFEGNKKNASGISLRH